MPRTVRRPAHVSPPLCAHILLRSPSFRVWRHSIGSLTAALRALLHSHRRSYHGRCRKWLDITNRVARDLTVTLNHQHATMLSMTGGATTSIRASTTTHGRARRTCCCCTSTASTPPSGPRSRTFCPGVQTTTSSARQRIPQLGFSSGFCAPSFLPCFIPILDSSRRATLVPVSVHVVCILHRGKVLGPGAWCDRRLRRPARRNHWNSTLKRKVQQGQLRPPTPQQAAELTARLMRAQPIRAPDTLHAAPRIVLPCCAAPKVAESPPAEGGKSPIILALGR